MSDTILTKERLALIHKWIGQGFYPSVKTELQTFSSEDTKVTLVFIGGHGEGNEYSEGVRDFLSAGRDEYVKVVSK